MGKFLRSTISRPSSLLDDITGFQARDFTALYHSIPVDDLLLRTKDMVRAVLDAERKIEVARADEKHQALRRDIMLVDFTVPITSKKSDARWPNEAKLPKDAFTVTADKLCEWLGLVVKNTFFEFGNELFHQLRGFPMGKNCGCELASIYLFTYEFAYILRCLAKLPSRSARLPPELTIKLNSIRY
jgi:hypothetical protein